MRGLILLWTFFLTLVIAQASPNIPAGKCHRKEYCRAPNGKSLSDDNNIDNPQKCEMYVATYDQEGKKVSESCHTKSEGWACDCGKCACSCTKPGQPKPGDTKSAEGSNRGDKKDSETPDTGEKEKKDSDKPDTGEKEKKDSDKPGEKEKKTNKLHNTDTHVSACLCEGDQKPVMQELENPCKCSCPALHGASQRHGDRTYMVNCKKAYKSDDVAKITTVKTLNDCGNQCSTWSKCVAVNFFIDADGGSRCILHTTRGDLVNEASSSFAGSLIQV
ncbi:hypothetical protein BJX99DRAFT_267166 [Aspergillus californicus]